MKEIYYKVLSDMKSFNNPRGAEAVKYIPNKYVEPKLEDSKLFVFRKYYQARNFVEKHTPYDEQEFSIWSCWVINPVKDKYLKIGWDASELFWTRWKKYIKGKLSDLDMGSFYSCSPDGTYVVDKICIREKLYTKSKKLINGTHPYYYNFNTWESNLAKQLLQETLIY